MKNGVKNIQAAAYHGACTSKNILYNPPATYVHLPHSRESLFRDHPYIMSAYTRTFFDPPMAIHYHKYSSERQQKWQLFEPTHPVVC